MILPNLESYALISQHASLTYRQLNQAIDALKIPYPKGSVVPFFPRNQIEDIIFLCACYRREIIPFPLSHRLPLKATREIAKKLEGRKDLEAATYILTSGSSSEPKIVRLSRENHLASAHGTIDFLGIDSSDRLQLSLPLFHVGGLALLFRTFLAHATLILDDTAPPTRLSFVPVQLKRALPHLDPQKIRSILLGGQALPPKLCFDALEKGFPIVTSYGMSEMGSQITGLWLKESFSLGMPLKERDLRIAPDGEIFVKGATLFLGYLDHESPFQEGWFPTKDLGKWDKELHVYGRKDRQFISGGENIHPEAIERALLSIEGIEEAYVAPQDDPEYGMRPVAHIHPLVKKEEIMEHLQTLLPKFMIPIRLEPLQKATKLSGNFH